jgi:SAM-dependent methyltransferase
MPPYRINDTTSYHRHGMKTLGWELTVCNALEEEGSPCREVTDKKSSFGNLLYEHLASHIPIDSVSSIIEIGGGYGFIMRDFLRRKGKKNIQAGMIDLSPVIIDIQKKNLEGYDVEFINQDFFAVDADFLSHYDLLIFNEVAGDFPTICNIDPAVFSLPARELDAMMLRVKNIFISYRLPVPDALFNLNLGAIDAVVKLCGAGVRYIYLSEHSCEAVVPEEMRGKINISGTGNPERIPLMGHDEYTIKFSHLSRIAEEFGYRVIRGQYKDFITYEYTGRVNFILTSHSQKDEHEIIRHFIEDLYKYEYLILIRDYNPNSRFL